MRERLPSYSLEQLRAVKEILGGFYDKVYDNL